MATSCSTKFCFQNHLRLKLSVLKSIPFEVIVQSVIGRLVIGQLIEVLKLIVFENLKLFRFPYFVHEIQGHEQDKKRGRGKSQRHAISMEFEFENAMERSLKCILAANVKANSISRETLPRARQG